MLWPLYVKKLLLCSAGLKVGYDKTAVHVELFNNCKVARTKFRQGGRKQRISLAV